MPKKTTKKAPDKNSTSTAVSAGEIETKTEVAVEESEAKKEFRLFMESYKIQNPVKYASKEAEFLSKLNQL